MTWTLWQKLTRLIAMTEIDAPTSHRQRLLAGLADVLEQKSFRNITLADIAAAARVSRRTFYEHFTSKDECLLALCEETASQMMEAVLKASGPEASWREEVRAITHAYLSVVQQRPRLMRALYIELSALGESGTRVRRQVAENFARFLQGRIEAQRKKGAELSSLSLTMGVAIVAGINELILYRLNEADEGGLMALAPDAEQLILRVSG